MFVTLSYAIISPVKRGIDTNLLSRINLMEQYAAAAYCPNNYNSPGNSVSCSSGNCPLVQSANTSTLVEFASKLPTDVTCFVAVDDTNRLIVTAFRGSRSIDNWLTNLQFDLVETNLCSGCQAHRGFWQSWLDSRTAVMAAIKDARKRRPDYTLVTVGHSLGGAVASLAAAQLRNEGYNVDFFSFGAPKVGGTKLSDYISNQSGGNNYRVTHWNDPIPRLPPQVMGYVHISPEYYIDSQNNRDVKPDQVRLCYGAVNYLCNNAWLVTDILAHLWYFNGITKCVAG
ncbi:alpha/beta-hydrolase [Westerdykella ornata]|uniref:Alpha/beta-hydrolase n=1 Tax=Westerdykella ornata TaxID=318751 RepID=A0A6A6JDL4_WESOR|nr:alpha/beta-hydrolase [Westerdykella ornata]KAF2273726.1 alpha/beta-hydrolase [Westerdykella ornata]